MKLLILRQGEMASCHQQTSLITLLSSEHGRMRREQRDINKRDLQKALKYGTPEPTWGRRWKVEYDGIVFITDANMRQEVTAYPSPLAFAPIDGDACKDHEKAKLVLERKPELCASHTILVVDNSGSMTTHDIHLHRDRQTAAYTATALEFVAEQLFSGTANNSDVVSLVEFSNRATVVFTREPVSWVLFNKLLERRDVRSFKARENEAVMDMLRCDSNYLPALEAAESVLSQGIHEQCALSLFFFSDGAPTDARQMDLTPSAANLRICEKIREIATRFDKQLNISMVGFGNQYQDFSTLEAMVQNAKDAAGDASAEFMYCSKMANMIGTAITSLVTSLVATRTALADHGVNRGRTKRNISSEQETQVLDDWKFYPIASHSAYDPYREDWAPYPGLPPGALKPTNQMEARGRRSHPPQYLAINSHSCGTGAERAAFRCQLSVDMRTEGFVLGTMVAKETNQVERIEEHIAFHRTFCETQDLAAYLADEFNKRLQALPSFDERTTPRIEFLECSVLVLKDPKWRDGLRGVLVEKMLDTERYGWCKWNDNTGGVEGQVVHIPIDVDYELQKLNGVVETIMEDIAEGASDDECESDDESEGFNWQEGDNAASQSNSANDDNAAITPSHYLQAFTHFTYRFTDRKVMVCDLQGVLNTDLVPPTFELSDPAVHYASKTGRAMVFGRTDKGKRGMQLFFNTHKCTDICKLMQLTKKNKSWNKQWRGRRNAGA